MIAKTAISGKTVILTSADFDRLYDLVKSSRYRPSHGVLLMSLKEELDRANVVSAADVPKNVVTMRSQVRIHDLDEDDSETYTLVYPDEADIASGKLSILAPLGMALLGTRVGDIVEFDAPAGTRRLKVKKLLYQPEAAGEFYL